jgi:hypothetical protein
MVDNRLLRVYHIVADYHTFDGKEGKVMKNSIKLQGNVYLVEENTENVLDYFKSRFIFKDEEAIREFIFKYYEVMQGAMEFYYNGDGEEVVAVGRTMHLVPNEEARSYDWFPQEEIVLGKNEAGLVYYEVF